MRLLIVSSVIHYRYGSGLYAYGPYAREVDIWADLFPEVIIAAPCRNEAPPDDCSGFSRSNISLRPQEEAGGETFKAKAGQILKLPTLVWGMSGAMREADAIHVRCPGNLGLLAIVLAPLFSKYLIAKYAGQWCGYPREPWSVRLQRSLLRSSWWRGPVTVYGRWPNQPSNVVPFFTSILTAEQIVLARSAATRGKPGDVLQVLYVGRLSSDKNVDVLLAAVANLRTQAIRLKCTIVGEGEHRSTLEAQAKEMGVDDCAEFVGGVSFEHVLGFYEQADVLVLASESEGWPKAITEGMAFGLICIGSNRGLVPEMLGEGRGLVVPPGDVDALAEALREIAMVPGDYQFMRARAAAWSQQYSLEGLREALRELLSTRWGISLYHDRQVTDAPASGVRS